jgi:hypothetical protein
MEDKRAARLAYYEGIKQAALEQFKITEEGLRNLEGLQPAHIEKLVADLHKRHLKLLKRIDLQIEEVSDT